VRVVSGRAASPLPLFADVLERAPGEVHTEAVRKPSFSPALSGRVVAQARKGLQRESQLKFRREDNARRADVVQGCLGCCKNAYEP